MASDSGAGIRAPPTPLLRSTPLSDNGREIFLKMDCFRPSGSFKDRGIGLKLSKLNSENRPHAMSSSGGNAGLATAVCGRRLGMRVTVVVPTTTKRLMLDKIRAEGAEVKVHGENWNAADDEVRRMIKEADGETVYVHPFDDEVMWQGHATLVHECHSQMREFFSGEQPEAIIVAVGGGGLLAGIAQGLVDVGWESTHIITAETIGSDALAQAVAAKQLVTLDAIKSIATSLGARRVSQRAFDIATGVWSVDGKKPDVKTVVVSDMDAVDACLRFTDDHRVLVEPACGAALSLVYKRHHVLSGYKRVVAVVCGGSGVSLRLLSEWKTQFLEDTTA